MPATTFKMSAVALTVSVMLLGATTAVAETIGYTAALKGASEVPAIDSKGVGTVEAIYDTTARKLAWTITYSGLSGPATAAHFHGPAAPTANAPPVLPLSGSLVSPIKGEAVLTGAQAADLQAGRWYLNVHTAAHKDGEVRGQVMKK